MGNLATKVGAVGLVAALGYVGYAQMFVPDYYIAVDINGTSVTSVQMAFNNVRRANVRELDETVKNYLQEKCGLHWETQGWNPPGGRMDTSWCLVPHHTGRDEPQLEYPRLAILGSQANLVGRVSGHLFFSLPAREAVEFSEKVETVLKGTFEDLPLQKDVLEREDQLLEEH